jgi:hypothetical protein
MKYTPLHGKRAFVEDWTHNGMTMNDAINYPTSTGAGLLLGEASDGIMALDFDGEKAWTFYDSQFVNRELLNTSNLIWSSGKPYRCQFAWFVPKEIWPHLKNLKLIQNEMEFRWSGCQSVIPPSIHPDTKKPYIWVRQGEPTEIPYELLEFWVNKCSTEIIEYKPITSATTTKLETLRTTVASVKTINSIIKNLHMMSPGNRDVYHCKIYTIIKKSRFTFIQKVQIIELYKLYDPDTKRFNTIKELLRER